MGNYEKGLQQLEKVKSACLRKIFGVKAHSSTEALEVISNILPIRTCVRDFVRIMRKPADGKIRSLLSSSTVRRNHFTPMSYMKYVARDFQRSLDNLEIEKEHPTTVHKYLMRSQ